MLPLSPKERRFAAEYLKDQNGTQAAIRAGYSKKTAQQQGSRLLSKVVVRKTIDDALAKITASAEVDQKKIIDRLWKIANVDIRQAFDENNDLKNIRDIPDDVAFALLAIDSDEIFEMINGRRQQTGLTKKLRLADKIRALELLGKNLKMFTDNTIPDGALTPVLIQMVPAQYDSPKNSKSRDDKSL